ncbi:MAG: L,D-transpeptidase family protein [Holophaga sp.]
MDSIAAAQYRSLAFRGLARPGSPFFALPARLLVADVAKQTMGLLEAGSLVAEYRISTAKNGIGREEGSYRTPPGWHVLHARIGETAPPGSVFRNRMATGEIWLGEPREEDLILTRVITLDGLEEGVNRGPGRDSLARFIYIHGTNQEHQLGTPVSHGCLRMGNRDVMDLFDRVAVGDILLVADTVPPGGLGLGRLHFAGVGGSGMSALAQFLALRGGAVSGSDRAFDRGQHPHARALLEGCGIAILPQGGQGVTGDCCGVVYSTAVEPEVPDFAEAQRLGVPLIHRSELLAHLVAQHRTLAITGTSGKSTTTAMVFEILWAAQRDPSVITGGELVSLQHQGLWGNAWAGQSDLLVIEADESDGSVVRYRPAVGVVLNLQRDHKEMSVVAEMFRVFRANTSETFVVGEAENLEEFSSEAVVFGLAQGADVRAEHLELTAEGSRFQVDEVHFQLPVPGRHNVENALAAIAACRAVGVSLAEMVAPLRGFQGVARRFQVLGEHRGVVVVDDFGHNPAKIAASLRAAQMRADRVLAVFQPHGYGPMRFLRQDFIEMFAAELRPLDRLWMLEIYYAGGTATRDISSGEIVAEIASRGVAAEVAPSREGLITRLVAEAQNGDLILVMGARDPSLTAFSKAILAAL